MIRGMRDRFDVIVVGGGPAGAVSAYCLADAGLRVALIDRARFPRDKTCGGGLQVRLFEHLPIDVRPVLRGAMSGIAFSRDFGSRFARRSPAPLVHGVLRREFDAFLVEAAAAKGAHVIDGVRVDAVEQNDGEAVVVTAGGRYHARVVVGADGANGIVRRTLNDETAFFTQAGLSCEIPRELAAEERLAGDLMRVDWGTLPSGYAWVFPKDASINVGVGAPVTLARRLRRYLEEFLARERLLTAAHVDLDALNVRGHKLPTVTRHSRLVNGRVLVVGDAAGFIEPFTGDGISYGVHSARLASDAIIALLAGRTSDLSGYERTAREEIASDLETARRVKALFDTLPRVFHAVFRRSDRAWRAACQVVRGEDPGLLRRNATRPIWRIVERVTRSSRRAVRPSAASP